MVGALRGAMAEDGNPSMPNDTLVDPGGITVGELRRRLEAFPDDAEISFGGLTFYQLKTRGPNVVLVEFSQTVYRADDGTLVVKDH
jgi:hypothetical protein